VIVFDLACAPAGHVFEGWFASSDDYERQREAKLVSCPICDSPSVAKAVMAPRLNAKGNQGPAADPAVVKQAMAALAAAQKKVLESSDFVGERFAEEARAIHLGEADARAIHGKATPEQAASLAEEGITVAPLPFPLVEPGQEN
jgi:hypothetical protein